jgi:hypothetical protein
MRRTTNSEDADFIKAVISTTLLEEAAKYIAENFDPEDVYSEEQLENWALENDFVKKD